MPCLSRKSGYHCRTRIGDILAGKWISRIHQEGMTDTRLLNMKLMMKCATLAAILGLVGTSQATQIAEVITVPAHVNLTVNETQCNNKGGPTVTLEGEITLGGVCAKVIFSNNAKGTHTAEVVSEADVVLSLGEKITIPKQPSRGGVGGNPHIWIQFTDAHGNALSEEVYLGRCVQGLNVSADLLTEALAYLTVTGGGCSNKGGPWITFDGTLVLSGVKAKLIFRNNLKGTHTAERTTSVDLIVEGEEIRLPKQPVRGGVGGNPLISVKFIDCETGEAVSDPVHLGRCNQL